MLPPLPLLQYPVEIHRFNVLFSMVKNPREISISDFAYPLPDELIARHPLADRDACRLLVSFPDGRIEDTFFSALPDLMDSTPGMMVFNNTKVIHARLLFRRATGAAIEVFLLEPLSPEDYVLIFQTTGHCEWACMVGNLKKWKEPALTRILHLADGTSVTLTATLGEELPGRARRILFSWDRDDITFASIVEAAGRIPIPPYLRRDTEESDEEDYQTVYSKVKGSVAAPTAGLHFTPRLLESLQAKGQQLAELTLHVGAGTFQPVKSDTIGGHPMHTETFSVEKEFLASLADAMRRQDENYTVTAVGTTSVRTLESLPYIGRHISRRMSGGEEVTAEDLHLSQWEAYEDPVSREEAPGYVGTICRWLEEHALHTLTASTAIMIAPGFGWNVVKRMITNFHQPSSTLLLLVASFLDPCGRSRQPVWRQLYDHALSVPYRFLSYGDACLLYPRS